MHTRPFTFSEKQWAMLIQHGDPAGWIAYYQQTGDEFIASECDSMGIERSEWDEARAASDMGAVNHADRELLIVVDSMAYNDICERMEIATEGACVPREDVRALRGALKKLGFDS